MAPTLCCSNGTIFLAVLVNRWQPISCTGTNVVGSVYYKIQQSLPTHYVLTLWSVCTPTPQKDTVRCHASAYTSPTTILVFVTDKPQRSPDHVIRTTAHAWLALCMQNKSSTQGKGLMLVASSCSQADSVPGPGGVSDPCPTEATYVCGTDVKQHCPHRGAAQCAELVHCGGLHAMPVSHNQHEPQPAIPLLATPAKHCGQ